MARLGTIHRYPVKSFAGESLAHAKLTIGAGIAGDRRYAVVPRAADGVRPAPGWRPKSQCFALVRHAELAAFGAALDDAEGALTLTERGALLARGRADNAEDRAQLEAALDRRLAPILGRSVVLAAAGAESLTDAALPLVSIVNRASVAALAEAAGADLDPLRFRANFYVEGVPGWEEMAWTGQRLRIGEATLEIIEPIERCAAIEIDPASGAREPHLLATLSRRFGHVSMGVFAAVRRGGRVACGDPVLIG